MKVFWSKRAITDLRRITTYIQKDNPAAAARVASRILEEVMFLATPPHGGVVGRVPGTYELIFYPWPYIAVYRVIGEQVRIIRIRHGAQKWPRI